MSNKFILIFLVLFFIVEGCGTKQAEKKTPTKQPISKPISKVEDMKAEVSQESPKIPEEGLTYNPVGKRDPFKSLIIAEREKVAKARNEVPPLQKIDASDLKFTGVIWDKERYVAMVETPDGKGFVVKEGMIVGLNKGIVKKITQRILTIEEKIRSYVGDFRTRKITLELHKGEEGQ